MPLTAWLPLLPTPCYLQVMGYGFTGNCDSPGDIYRHDYSRGDNRCNLIWWRNENSNTTEDGHLVGGAPNVFRSRVPPAVDAVRSVVLYPSPADSKWLWSACRVLMCCGRIATCTACFGVRSSFTSLLLVNHDPMCQCAASAVLVLPLVAVELTLP